MTNAKVKTAVRKQLLRAVASQAGVDAAQAVLNEKRVGMYDCCVQAGIAANGDKAAFMEVTEALITDFRENKRGIAVKFNCEQSQDRHGNLKWVDEESGKAAYKVPGSLSTAKSVIGGAFDTGTALGTASKPNPFSAIRDASALAKKDAAKASASPLDKVHGSIIGKLEAMIKSTPKLDMASAQALDSLLTKFEKGTKAAAKASVKAKPRKPAKAKAKTRKPATKAKAKPARKARKPATRKAAA